MQAKPLHTFPTHIPQPVRRNPVQQKSLSLPTIPRAISISVPDTRVAIPAPPSIDIDDSITAFWDYQFLFVSQRYETTQPINLRIVDGTIPADFPSGTYYLTGPGLFADDHGSTVHPLDGHGYLRAFTIDNVTKKVKYMAKYIKTEAQVEEHDPKTNTWRFTHRGPFSVLKGGRKVGNTKVMKNVANTSVLRWGEKLLCMWEGGDPYEIESHTLDTVGQYNMIDGNNLEGYDKKYDVDIWEVAARLLKPLLYEYDSNFKLVEKQEFKIPDHMMIHDWAFTDTHYIIFANRIKLDVLGYDWQNHKLDPSMMNIKGGNELLPHIIQVSIKLDSDYKCQECNVKSMQNWKKSSDFPIINPSFSGKKNRYLYAATTLGSRKTLPSFPFDTVVKLDLVNDSVQTWTVGSRRFIGEPIFVPKGHDEDDGYLLVVEYAVSMQRCYLVILNPKRIGSSNSVVARLEIPRHLNFPLGFHGFWAPNETQN
ncbi:unnamed protein product [Lupinus luteus]|uniref:Carotenoid cleavage dioxygenase 7 n=1 Tax=Lupinus luteus TaxID=3873 RepID=A0AAV1W1A9_LUPLU